MNMQMRLSEWKKRIPVLPEYQQPIFLVKIIIYVGTGILQPMIIDSLRLRHCLGRTSLLLPTLAKTMGMSLVGVFSTSADRSTLRQLLFSSSSQSQQNSTVRTFRRSLLLAASIDLLSGMMLTGGILLTGGAIFVVLYNSTPAWTALLSKYLLHKPLSYKQTMGISIVCLGLMCNIFGTHNQLNNSNGNNNEQSVWILIGSVIVLLGCILHALFFVISAECLSSKTTTTTTNKEEKDIAFNNNNKRIISPALWSSCLGTMEASVMLVYVLTSVYFRGFQPHDYKNYDDELQEQHELCHTADFLRGFITMLLVDCIHSTAFYFMLQQIGAVGSALLKGMQSVAVVLLSAVFFCPHEEAQCLTTIKAISVLMVLLGTCLYAASTDDMDDEQYSENNENNTNTAASDHPDHEVERLLK